jgi:hypothetical protein
MPGLRLGGGPALGAAGPALAAPGGIPAAGLAAYFEPAAGGFTRGASGTTITSIPNRGSLGGSLDQNEAGEPAIRYLNGLPVASLDGDDDELASSLAASAWEFLHDGTPWTAYIAVDDGDHFTESSPYLATCRGNASDTGISFNRASGSISFRMANGAAYAVSGSSSSTWSLGPAVYAVVFDGSDVTVWRNGAQVMTAAVANAPGGGAPDATLTVGSQPGGTTLHANFDLAAIAIYRGIAHTDATRKAATLALLRRWFPVLALEGLVAAFAGGHVVNPAAFIDAAGESMSSGLGGVPTFADGRFSFVGASTESIRTATAYITDFAATAWTYVARAALGSAADGLGADSAGTPRMYLAGGSVAYDGLNTVQWTGATGWQLLVYRFDGSTLDVFRDGVLVASRSGIAPPVFTAGRRWSVGVAGANFLNGDLDRYGLWDRALTDEEIALISSPERGWGVTPEVFQPVAWYEARNGDLALDLSGNGRVATGTPPTIVERASPTRGPVARFDGVDDYLRASFTLAQPYFVAVTGRVSRSGGGLEAMVDGGSGAANSMRIGSGVSGASTPDPTISFNAGGNLYPNNVALDVSVFRRFEVFADGASTTATITDPDGGTSAGNAGTAAPGGITMGANGSLTKSDSDIETAVILPLTANPTGRNLTNIRRYLDRVDVVAVYAEVERAVAAAGGSLFDPRPLFEASPTSFPRSTPGGPGEDLATRTGTVSNGGEFVTLGSGYFVGPDDTQWTDLHRDGCVIIAVARADTVAGTGFLLDNALGANLNAIGVSFYRGATSLFFRITNGSGATVVANVGSGSPTVVANRWQVWSAGWSAFEGASFAAVDGVGSTAALSGDPTDADPGRDMHLGAATTGGSPWTGDLAALVVLPAESYGTNTAHRVQVALERLRDVLAL